MSKKKNKKHFYIVLQTMLSTENTKNLLDNLIKDYDVILKHLLMLEANEDEKIARQANLDKKRLLKVDIFKYKIFFKYMK